ncbi:MAG: hypothetical protein ABI640_21860 [Gammaproteobacteria bacterium]
MALGIGASHATSSGESASLDLGLQQASSESNSSGASQGTSQSFSDALTQAVQQSQGQSSSSQSVFNADALQKLYAQATGAAGQVDTGLFTGQAADLYNSGSKILDSLGVGAGEDYLSSRLTDTSARDQQLGALSSGLGDLFRNQLNPAITGNAVSVGGLGGSRQGVAQGVAAGQIAQQYQQGAASIYASDQAQRDAAAGTLINGKNQAAGVGIQGIQSQLGVAQAGLGAPLSPYTQLAGILGPATTLTTAGSTDSASSSSTSTAQSQSQSQQTSEEIARAISESLGLTYGTSSSANRSSSASFNFGL